MNDELKNEIADLKEIVRSIHGTVVSTREYVETMDRKIDSVRDELKEDIEKTQNLMQQGFEAMNEKIDSVQEDVQGISGRMQGIENRADRLNERVLDELWPVKVKNKELEKRMFALEKLQAA